MNKILSFLWSKKIKKNVKGKKFERSSENSWSSEIKKITNFHYQSKFTAANDKIHEKMSNQSQKYFGSDIEELESLKIQNVNQENIELNKFDIFILSLVCFCVELGSYFTLIFK